MYVVAPVRASCRSSTRPLPAMASSRARRSPSRMPVRRARSARVVGTTGRRAAKAASSAEKSVSRISRQARFAAGSRGSTIETGPRCSRFARS